jgi:hypothetical protein
MLRSLVMLILMCVFAIATLYVEGPGLRRDFELRNASLVPAPDLKVEQARCTLHWWIMSNCSISYSAPPAREKKYSLSFSVFGSLGGERFRLMRAPDNRVTTDIALAKLTNRITAAIFVLGAFSMIGLFALRRVVAAV